MRTWQVLAKNADTATSSEFVRKETITINMNLTYSCIKIKIKTDNKNKIITINRSIKTTLEGAINTIKRARSSSTNRTKTKQKPHSIKITQRGRTSKN